MASLRILSLKNGSFTTLLRGDAMKFSRERTRLRHINEAIENMESMMLTAPKAIQAVLQKNIDRSKKDAKTILNQMILDGYTGENHGRP